MSMKGYTSRHRFDEQRRFVAVHEEMGRARLDADANEQALIALTDTRRRSADVAEGSPDDGFRLTETFLLDAITSTAGWTATGLPPGDERVIVRELRLERRDPETLPYVLRTRGHVAVQRLLPAPLDLLALPEPGHHTPDDATWQAEALQVRLRIERRANDDEVADTHFVVRDVDEAWHAVAPVPAGAGEALLRIPLTDLAPLQRGAGAGRRVVLTGWGVTGLPPRAETDVDALAARPADLGDDLVVRGGGGTPATAGRLYADGRRVFIAEDWRYSTQPYLPVPPPLDAPDGAGSVHHLLYADIVDREVHAWQDPFIAEPALDGDPTTFRRQQVVQIRARRLEREDRAPLPALPTPTGDGRLTSAVPEGALPERIPPEEPDRCRERCLYTEQISLGEGYLGSVNAHVRVEVLGIAGADRLAVVWSRDNGALAAPLAADLPADGVILTVDPFHAARFRAGDVVTLEDRASRLDPGDARHHPILRRLRSVDSATGRLELEPAGHFLTDDPAELHAGGAPGRPLLTSAGAAVRRWDGADWLLTGLRFRLVDNITFAFSGAGFRPAEHWTFTARVVAPDSRAQGVVERRVNAPPDGPHHVRVPLALVTATRAAAGAPLTREIADLRQRFLPLKEVRDRLIELGARHLAPGAFTVVVGDGQRTFGDIDQNLAEGVTGDEAIHAAIAELAGRPGTIYVRAGTYVMEHPVVLQGLSGVRVLGDGPATRLEVRGAGGAFVLDDCGWQAGVSLELMDLVEAPGGDVPIGGEAVGGLVGELIPVDDGGGPLRPDDLAVPGGGLAALLDTLRASVAGLRPRLGRASASVVATILELRRLQRRNPGQPLEDVAPAQLATLRRLPHGVVSVGDSHDVRLHRLGLDSSQRGVHAGTVGAGVLLTGTLAEITVSECEVRASSGVVAAALARSLAPAALVLRPRSGLQVRGLRISGNDLRPAAVAVQDGQSGDGVGVRVADGDVEGVVIEGNDIDGFAAGILLQDRAEVRHGEALPRTAVRGNRVLGATGVGIDVLADGVEVDANEIRLAAAGAAVRAGIRVAGAHTRITACTVALPATSPAASPLDLEAGVVVGQGVEDGTAVARLVEDVTVSDTHISGRGPATSAHGILIGGAAPIRAVTMSRCSVRSVGGSGIRAIGHGAVIGELRVEGCHLTHVADRDIRWSGAIAEAVAALVPGIAGNSPGQLLEALLAADEDATRRAIDGLLRWTEQATLRGGVILSLVDDAVVVGNRINEVGRHDLVAQITNTDVHIAGVAVLGGEAHLVNSNHISGVRGAVRRAAVVRPPVIVRPGIIDVLDRLSLTPLNPAGDLHGAIVGLRGLTHRYAVGDEAERQQLGYRIYGAMEAVQDGLATRGAQASRLATRLADAIEVMRSAQGYEGHTDAAFQVRSLASQAAELTSPDPDTAEVWGYALRLDRTLESDEGAIVEAAGDVADAAPRLMEGLGLSVDLAEAARRVVAAAGAARREAAQELSGALGQVAAARKRARTARRGVRLSGRQTRLLSTLSENIERRLPGGQPAREVTRELVEGMAQGVDALTEALGDVRPELSTTVRHGYERLRRGDGAPPDADVAAFGDAIGKTRAFLTAPEQGAAVDDADAASEQAVADGQLVMLTADWIDRRLSSLASSDMTAETRSLGLLGHSARQLVRLAGDHPELQDHAREVNAALEQAEADPGERATHTRRAATALAALRTTQAKIVAAPPATAPVVVDNETDERTAALTQLLRDLGRDDGREERAAGAQALVGNLRQTVAEGVDLPAGERRALLDDLDGVERELAADGARIARRRALHRVASVLQRVADAAAEQRSTAESRAVATLAAALREGLAPTAAADERLAVARSVIAAARDTLSPSSAAGLLDAADLPSLLGALDRDLGSITGVLPRLPVPRLPDEVVTPQPADGILTAQVTASVAVNGNVVEGGRRGVVVGGAGIHPLAPLAGLGGDDGDESQAVEVSIVNNTVRGAVVAGITIDLDDPARVRVDGNDLQGCGGAATPAEDTAAPGRGIVEVRGRGQASLRGNRLDGNGSSSHPGLIHGLVVRLDGDVTVTGNRVRHTGGQVGGAGILVVQGAIPAAGGDSARSWDFTALCNTPFLDVDPPPRPRAPATPVRPTLPPNFGALLASGITGTVAGSALPDAPAGLATGALAGAIRPGSLAPGVSAAVLASARPPALSLATTSELLLAPPHLADALADQWLAAQPEPEPDLGRIIDLRPLLDFLRRPPWTRVPLPPLRVIRTLQVGGNDVVSRGPALLAFGSAIVRLQATVSGNTLVSTGQAGAVYLRDVDVGVVSGNRLECGGAVTVLLVRARDGLVSISGNVVAGREPPTSHLPPRIVRPGGVALVPPKVTLAVDLGEELGGQLALALDPGRVLEALRGQRDVVAAKTAADASASFTTFAETHRIVSSPRAAAVLDTAVRVGILDTDLERLAVRPELRNLPAEPITVRAISPLLRAQPRAFDVGGAPGAPAVAGPGGAGNADDTNADPSNANVADDDPVAPEELGTAITRLTADFDTILRAGDLSPATKLFGLAKSSGLPESGAKALVQQQLLRSHGDEEAALHSGLGVLTGVAPPPPAPPKGKPGLPLLESLLGPVLDDPDLRPILPDDFGPGRGGIGPVLPSDRPGRPPFLPLPPLPPLPLPRPPAPGRHSLVVLGGAQVALAGNATAAGAYVEPAES